MPAILSPSAKQQFFDNAGNPAAGYQLFTYASNTTTPEATYSNRAGTVANTNPIILDARGEAIIYLTPGVVYDYVLKTGSGALVWTREDVIADAGDANAVSFLQAGTGAVVRASQDKMRETVSIKDYGAVGDGVTDDLQAFVKALIYLESVGGGRLYLPSGTYNVSGSIDISSIDCLWIDGCGQDNTTIVTSHVSAPVLYSNADRNYRKFSNFTIDSSVTRTSGAFIDFLVERRSILEDLKLTGWFDGINMRGFEETEIRRVKIVNPTGAGTALIVGTFNVFGSGANLHVTGCFLRGNDDIAQGPPVASTAILVNDCDALYMLDVDIGGFTDSDMIVNAAVRAANFHVTSCYFDATKNGHCILVQGAGAKQQWSFTNCWIASAGQLTGGSNNVCGLFFADQGSYASIMFTGCRFYSNKASGAYIGKAGTIQFTGCNFESNGAGGAGNQYGLKADFSAAVGPGPVITGCVFTSNTPKAIQTTANTRAVVISGTTVDNGVDMIGGTYFMVDGYDQTAAVLASATTLTVSPFWKYVRVTGTTNITGMAATFSGHLVTLKFDGALTVVDASTNLAMAGNYVTAAGSILTFRCDGTTWWETGRVNT